MSYNGMKPVHTHDCTNCVFVANIHNDGQDLDAYVCPNTGLNGTGSVLLRHGSEGPEYWSVPLGMVDQVAGPMSIYGTDQIVMSATGILAQWVLKTWKENLT